MAASLLKTSFRLLLVTCCFIAIGTGLIASNQKGFEMCREPQKARLVEVLANGPGCRRKNGRDLWPCYVFPGRDGFFDISFIHYSYDDVQGLKSSIHASLNLAGVGSFTGMQRIGLSGEVDKDACPDTFYDSEIGPYYGCPIQGNVTHTIRKKITVPSSVRFAQSNMKVEFKLKNLRGETLICFRAPIINR